MTGDDKIRAMAHALDDARRMAAVLEPGADAKALDLAGAYAVQEVLASLAMARGDQTIGWKVGLTSTPAMQAFGALEPIAGPMFASSRLDNGATLDFARTCDARVEGELLLELGSAPDADADDVDLAASIASLRPAIEIADSRWRGWPAGAAMAVADNACCGWLVTGDPVVADARDLAGIAMRMTVDGRQVVTGNSSACLGSPLNVLRWLAQTAGTHGWMLRAGDLILTGALAPPVPASRRSRYEVVLDALGDVGFAFGD